MSRHYVVLMWVDLVLLILNGVCAGLNIMNENYLGAVVNIFIVVMLAIVVSAIHRYSRWL